MNIDLRTLLAEHCDAEASHIQEVKIANCLLTILQIRDQLYLLGSILYEDLEHQVYVAAIRSGFGNMNHTIVAMQLQGTEFVAVGYAKEGLIDQHTCEKALLKLKNAVLGVGSVKEFHSHKILPLVLFAVVLVCFVTVRGYIQHHAEWIPPTSECTETLSAEEAAFEKEVQQTIHATREYNKAVAQFNLSVEEYNQAVSVTCIDNIDGMPAILEPLKTEHEGYDEVAEAVRNGIRSDIIISDTKTVQEMTVQVESLTTVVKQITAPTAEWLIDRLSDYSSITGIQAVTEDLDPDQLLGKEGGYSACVYFTVSSIDASTVPGNTIVEKGTDAGGAIEVYATVEEAQARCDYLSGFDGTVLYSGSYAIVGTMVIRTSYKLDNAQQMALTRAITRELTTLVSI